MSIADLPEDRQVFFGRIDHTAGMPNRLDHDRGDGLGVFHLDDLLNQCRAGQLATRVLLTERAPVAGRREDMQEAGSHRFIDRLSSLQSRR